MKIGNSVYLDAVRSVGAKFDRGNNCGLESDIDSNVGSGDGKVFE